MSDIQTVTEPTMEEYAAQRTSSPEVKVTEENKAAITPPEKVTTAPESAPGTSETDKEESKSKTGGGWQRRIDKLTKRNSEIEETLNDERLARQRLEAKLAGRDPADSTKKNESAGARQEPQPTDANPDGTPKYTDWNEFQKDLRKWDREQIRAELLGEVEKKTHEVRARTEAEKQAAEITKTFTERLDAVSKKYSDFKEIVEGEDSPALEIPQGSVMDAAILDSEHGAEMLYKLCQKPEEIKRIAALPPMQQAREMFKLEQSLTPAPSEEKEKQPPEPKKSTLPTPIKPVSGGTSKSTVKLDEVSMDEYVRQRKAK